MKKILLLLITVSFMSFSSSIESIELIGKWTGEEKGDVLFLTFDVEGYALIERKGIVIGGKEFELNGKKGKMTYEINSNKNPMEIDMIITKLETNEEKRILCIAEFIDEDHIVFAMKFEEKRPSDFNNENTINLTRVE